MPRGHSNRNPAPRRETPLPSVRIYNQEESTVPRRTSISRRIGSVAAVALLFAGVSIAGKEFSPPTANPAASYPANDQHTDEKVTVAVDPYDMPDKAAIFSTKYLDVDMLPVFVIITNDSDEPITLSGMKAQFVTNDRTKLAPATQDDLYRRLSRPQGPRRVPLPIPVPIPLPNSHARGAVTAKALDEMQRAQFSARAVEPHSTQSGFLFFDVSGLENPLPGAHFFLTGLRNGKGDDLYYFEIALEKYLSVPQPEKPVPPTK